MERPRSFPYRTLCFAIMMMLFFVAPPVLRAASVFEGVTIAERYEPGDGVPVGNVVLVEGVVVVVHADTPGTGYGALSDMPLYKGDTLMTGSDGKVSFQTKDGSLITLSTDTRLVITESIYEPGGDGGGDRATFLHQLVGKVRFLIQKMTNFSRSEFKVKTRTAIVGVRGSDFVVRSTARLTQVFAFEDTQLEITGMAGPCPDCPITPSRVSDFSRTIVELGGRPMDDGLMRPDEVDLLKHEFDIRQDDADRRMPREQEFERVFLTSGRSEVEDPPPNLDPPMGSDGPGTERGVDPGFSPPPLEPPDRPAEDLGEDLREAELRILPEFPVDPDSYVPPQR